MRLLKVSSLKLALGLSVIISLYDSSIFTSGFPQWVWNPDAATAPSSQGSGGTRVVFTNKEADSVNSVGGDQAKIKLSDSQARLFPQILGAITQSFSGGSNFNRPNAGGSSSSSSSGDSNSGNYPGNGGSNGGTSATCNGANCNLQCSGGAIGACIGNAIASQAIDQGSGIGSNLANNPSVFGNFIQSIFGGGAQTLPAGINGINVGGTNKDPVESCTCNDVCFLPSKEYGNCDGSSKVRCCTTTRGIRTYFPDEDDRYNRYGNGVRTVTRSQIRRQLLRNIVSGSGSLLDDTLDLFLHPFLSKEDQLKVATRVLIDG